MSQTALITNMFDPHDTCNVCMTGQVVRGDRPDPIRAIYLTKWLVKASYTDENEEISLVIKKNGSLTDQKNALSAPDRKILPESIFPTNQLSLFLFFGSRFGSAWVSEFIRGSPTHQRPLTHPAMFTGFSPAPGTDLGRQIPSGAASWVQLLSNMYEQLFIS